MPIDSSTSVPIAVPTGWDCVELDELVEPSRGISYGIVQPGKHQTNGVPILRVNNIRRGRIDTTDSMRVSQTVASKFRRTVLRGGELVLSLVGTLGECAVVPSDLAGWNVARAVAVIPLKAGVDPRWVELCLRSAAVQSLMRAWATTTVQATLNLRDVRRLPVLYAPQTTRTAITSVSRSIDDKIEQLQRTASALERLARAIFRAWTVGFEPVHAKATGAASFPSMPQEVFDALPTKLVDTNVGGIPDGWTPGTLGDVAKEIRDGAKPAEIDPATPYIGLEHMPKRSISLNDWEHVAKVTSNKSRFRAGQILFGKLRPYFHKVGVAPIDGVCSTDVVVVEPLEASYFGLVLGVVASDGFVAYTTACSTGTKMPRTKWADMKQFSLVVPQPEVLHALSMITRSFTDQIVANIHETHALAALREYLLPELLSGQVRVEGAPNG